MVNSEKESRIGNQQPTIRFTLPYEITEGDLAADLYELSKRKAFEWQRNVVRDILATNAAGRWIHNRYGYEVPRQNGKGEILSIVELYALAVGLKVMHTSHRTDTSHAAWERLVNILEDIGIEYHSIKAKGREIIEIRNGNRHGRIEYRTRSTKGGLGESYDILIIDEAQEYQYTEDEALKYTISASPNPLIIFCGTPPTPQSSGTFFVDYREGVLSGQREDAGWCEWSVADKVDVTDKEYWYQTNPSLGLRLAERTIKQEIGNSEAERQDFLIQRLGYWSTHNLQSAVQKKDWDVIRAKEMPEIKGKLSVGIKFNNNGESVSMAVAARTTEEKIFFEVLDRHFVREGMDWIITALIRLNKSVNTIIIDGQNGQDILVDELKKNKIKNVVKPTVTQVIDANALFEKNLFEEKLERMEQPSLTQVVTNCKKRRIGNKGGFGYDAIRTEYDISLMDSAILAAWAVNEYRERKPAKISY